MRPLLVAIALLWLATAVLVYDHIDEPDAGLVPAQVIERPPTTPPSEPPPTTSTTVAITTSTSMPRSHETAPIGVWDSLAACESGGRWHLTEGGHEGGLQFLHSTWVAAGGRRFAEHAYDATREQQIEIAKGWLARTSPNQWPECGPRVGLTMAAAA